MTDKTTGETLYRYYLDTCNPDSCLITWAGLASSQQRIWNTIAQQLIEPLQSHIEVIEWELQEAQRERRLLDEAYVNLNESSSNVITELNKHIAELEGGASEKNVAFNDWPKKPWE